MTKMSLRPQVLVFGTLVLLAFAVSIAAWHFRPDELPATVAMKAFTCGVAAMVCALISWWEPFDEGLMQRHLVRRYYRDAMPPLGVFVLFALLRRPLLAGIDDTALRVAIALVPGLCIALVLRATLRFVRDSDELQRRIELESIAIAAMLTSVLYTSTGFLQRAGLLQIEATKALEAMFPLLCLLYVGMRLLIARRYR